MKCEYCSTENAGDGRGRCVNCGAPYVSFVPRVVIKTPDGNYDEIGIDFSNPRNQIVIPKTTAWEMLNWSTATS